MNIFVARSARPPAPSSLQAPHRLACCLLPPPISGFDLCVTSDKRYLRYSSDPIYSPTQKPVQWDQNQTTQPSIQSLQLDFSHTRAHTLINNLLSHQTEPLSHFLKKSYAIFILYSTVKFTFWHLVHWNLAHVLICVTTPCQDIKGFHNPNNVPQVIASQIHPLLSPNLWQLLNCSPLL